MWHSKKLRVFLRMASQPSFLRGSLVCLRCVSMNILWERESASDHCLLFVLCICVLWVEGCCHTRHTHTKSQQTCRISEKKSQTAPRHVGFATTYWNGYGSSFVMVAMAKYDMILLTLINKFGTSLKIRVRKNLEVSTNMFSPRPAVHVAFASARASSNISTTWWWAKCYNLQ